MKPAAFAPMRPIAAALLLTAALGGCQLPGSGPGLRSVGNMPALTPAQPENQTALPPVAMIDVDDAVSMQLAQADAPQSLADLGGSSGHAETVGVGDILEITLWESPPAVLFGGAINSLGSGTAQTVKLPDQPVAANGTVSVPFLGSLNVRGKTPQQIQQQIVAGLHRKANQPQALVRLAQNNAATATVIREGKSVRLPLTAQRERVLDAVAAVGGTEQRVQDVSLQLTRGSQVRTVALETVTADPAQNIVLRPGDVLTMQANPLSFTALGAVGRNQKVEFAAKGMNLGEAIGSIGGLIDRRSDPRGVFVFRYLPLHKLPQAQQDAWRNQGYAENADVPAVYRFDLTQPQSLFHLQRFAVRNKDIVYVANSPTAEIQKFMQLLFSPVTGAANTINNLSN